MENMFTPTEGGSVVLDLTSCRSVSDIHGVLKNAFGFPAYYGENWDALGDCLCGYWPHDASAEVRILGFNELPAELQKMCAPMMLVFDDVREYAPGVTFTFIPSKGQEKIVFYPRLPDGKTAEEVKNLLITCDAEFIPPLSARRSAVQKDFSAKAESGEGIDAYFADMQNRPVLIAYKGETTAGFMAFRENYTSQIINASCLPNVYISTVLVHPAYRRQGLTTSLYRSVMEKFADRKVFTRTWSTNAAHIGLLSRLGFSEYARLADDRGKGMDTLYFCLTDSEKKQI